MHERVIDNEEEDGEDGLMDRYEMEEVKSTKAKRPKPSKAVKKKSPTPSSSSSSSNNNKKKESSSSSSSSSMAKTENMLDNDEEVLKRCATLLARLMVG